MFAAVFLTNLVGQVLLFLTFLGEAVVAGSPSEYLFGLADRDVLPRRGRLRDSHFLQFLPHVVRFVSHGLRVSHSKPGAASSG